MPSSSRHVLKFTNTCQFACHVQILSDNHDFTFGDEDQLLNKILASPVSTLLIASALESLCFEQEDVEFLRRAEELLLALGNSVQNFHSVGQEESKLTSLFASYCKRAPKSDPCTLQACSSAFNQALYVMLRTMLGISGSPVTKETQFAWRCFTNDLATPDILGVYKPKTPSNESLEYSLLTVPAFRCSWCHSSVGAACCDCRSRFRLSCIDQTRWWRAR